MKIKYKTLLYWSLWVFFIETFDAAIKWKYGISIFNTYATIALNFFILIIAYKNKYFYVNKAQKKEMTILTILLLWYVFSILRGLFIADDYWTYKTLLFNSFGLISLLFVYVLTNHHILNSYLRFYLRYILPTFLVIMIFIPIDKYGHILMPISYLILFFPLFPNRIKLIIVVLACIGGFTDLGARGNVIRFLVPGLLVVLYYFRNIFIFNIWKILHIIFMFAPILFFTLGATGTFNIFNPSSYISASSARQLTKDQISDSRTFIYKDILMTMSENEKVFLIGVSPARGYKTDTFLGQQKISGKNERFSSEIGLGNIFVWTGFIGVVLYFLVFFYASYLAVYRSNNVYSKMIGVSLAFRWDWSWVSDYTSISLLYLSIILLLASSFSISFRKMTNKEVKSWIRTLVHTKNKFVNKRF